MFLISRTLRHIKHYVCKINSEWKSERREREMKWKEKNSKKVREAGGKKIINWKQLNQLISRLKAKPSFLVFSARRYHFVKKQASGFSKYLCVCSFACERGFSAEGYHIKRIKLNYNENVKYHNVMWI